MAWSGSQIFASFVTNPMLGVTGASGAGLPTGYAGLVADTVNLALYAGSITPDATAAVASTGYNTGQWVTGGEITGSSEWVAGGRAVPATKSISQATNVTTFKTTTNLVGAATVTMSGINGCLVYDNTISAGTVAKQGVCFLWFGGAQSVTAGTFSVNFNASGIFTFTV
jgi:hypothetical protein